MNDRDRNRETGNESPAAPEAGDAKVTPFRKPRPCPICGKTSVHRWHPFCSRRCADIDLSRWLKGAYAIPVVEEDGAAHPSDHEED